MNQSSQQAAIDATQELFDSLEIENIIPKHQVKVIIALLELALMKANRDGFAEAMKIYKNRN